MNRDRTQRLNVAGTPEAQHDAQSDDDQALLAEIERMAAGRRVEKLGPGHYLVVDEDLSEADSKVTDLLDD